MGMFNSRHECKVDPKGRLALPAKLKAAIPDVTGGSLYLRFGDDGCLALYPEQEFKKLYNKINGLSDRDPIHRRIKRSFFDGLVDVELDSAGRFLIPKNFLAYAGIDKEAYVNGVGSYIEIWSPEKYEKNMILDQAELTALMDQHLS
ncbi:division/cell wall cluster transcriptional repressor MraZ [Belliella kenyensis]|uniref:Transcriptional regulator MraZ n=1 Tax=Belliella kenyensis TaxID=1472724 RepID=A0ABV8ENU4_9BACT|nr:division/cell wall cluster transcriptional repressor MraZ [Belliella kenyensis]MCH7403827.1 division/cell wall cluster transcriptional repressor MraZ [Belliella kenyensis]MDN3602461.1 division/cell wall cluster transcriptional repressor MraZ [Belliella kenyensis]